MQTAGVADVGDVRLFSERLVKRGKRADVVDLFDVALLVSAHGWSDDVGEPPDAVGDNFDRIAEESAKVAGVALTDAAETDDKDFHDKTPEIGGSCERCCYGQKLLTNASCRRIQFTSSPS